MTNPKNSLRKIIDGAIYFESFFHHRPTKREKAGRRVLILRKDGLGDCIIFYPTLKLYREFYKDAEITLIFPKLFQTLAPLLTDVDKVIWFDHRRFGSNFFYRRRFLLDLKQTGYDVAIYPVFSREAIGDLMIKITAAKERIEFGVNIITPPEMISELDRDVYFAEKVTGKKAEITFPTIEIEKLPKEKALELIHKNHLIDKQFIFIFPETGNYKYRIWPLERFAAIIEFIIEQGLTPVICSSIREKPLVVDILNRVNQKVRSKVIDLSGQTNDGKTDFADLAHLLHHSLFYFGSDTGPLHLAVALGVPSIAIVGSGGLRRFFPYGDSRKNRALYDKEHSYTLGGWDDAYLYGDDTHPSIKNISVGSAKKEIEDLLRIIKP